MKFKEEAIELPIIKKPLVYFLLKEDGEVVYVGQTKNGLSRPYSHIDKDFDKIKIIKLPENMLSQFEDYYIYKYEPIYNNTIKFCSNYKILRVRNLVREVTGKNITIPKLRKIFILLDINVYFSGDKEYIHISDVIKVLKYVQEVNYEK